MTAQFDFIKRLGSGNFGEVWLANDINLDHKCALKCIPIEKVTNPNNFFHEAQILKKSAHPNIIKISSAGQLKDGRIYLAMEYLKKGSLEDEVKGAHVHLTRAKKIMIDVLRGLEHAHSKEIIHRDIKPANILVSDSFEGKLADFGLALSVNELLSRKNSTVGHYEYLINLAPEVNSFKDHTHLSDIYACGVTLYRLVNGDSYLPSRSMTAEIKKAIINGKFPNRKKYRYFIPRPMKVLINRAMNVSPKKRFESAKNMRRSLEGIKININWNERRLQNIVRWSASHNQWTYRIELRKNGKWNVTVKKGSSNSYLRKVNRLCHINMKKTEATKIARRILQDFVLGAEN